MSKKIFSPILSLALLGICTISYGQEKLEVEGAISIKNSQGATPTAGTIRFNSVTHDFEGWNGFQWLSLTRSLAPGEGVADIEGNHYTTAKLGTQEWMAQNLRVTKYNDNTGIPQVTSNLDWSNLSTGAWCWYNNDILFGNGVFGRLYNWHAVNSNKLCPTGWHLPSHNEWSTLRNYLEGSNNASNAGGKMKETGLAYWAAPNTGATNVSGFNGVAGGYRNVSGTFSNKDFDGWWWSATEYTNLAYTYWLSYSGINLGFNVFDKRFGYSVRCIKN